MPKLDKLKATTSQKKNILASIYGSHQDTTCQFGLIFWNPQQLYNLKSQLTHTAHSLPPVSKDPIDEQLIQQIQQSNGQYMLYVGSQKGHR